MKSGIYRIYNMLNHKNYVGQSRDVYRRIREHIRLLSRGEHHSAKLQADYDRFGIGAFRFEILEFCEPRELTKKEAHYIKQFNAIKNGYNTLPVIVKPEPKKQSEPERKVESIKEKAVEEVAPQEVKVKETKEMEVVSKEWNLRDLLKAVKENHLCEMKEKLGASISPIRMFIIIVASAFLSMLLLYSCLVFIKIPGIIIGVGIPLFVVMSMMVYFDYMGWMHTKEVKKLFHVVITTTYVFFFSLFYLVYCIYMLWTNDPVTKEFNIPIVTIMSIILLLMTSGMLLQIVSVVFKPKKLVALVNWFNAKLVKWLVKMLFKTEKKLDEKLEGIRKSEYGRR